MFYRKVSPSLVDYCQTAVAGGERKWPRTRRLNPTTISISYCDATQTLGYSASKIPLTVLNPRLKFPYGTLSERVNESRRFGSWKGSLSYRDSNLWRLAPVITRRTDRMHLSLYFFNTAMLSVKNGCGFFNSGEMFWWSNMTSPAIDFFFCIVTAILRVY